MEPCWLPDGTCMHIWYHLEVQTGGCDNTSRWHQSQAVTAAGQELCEGAGYRHGPESERKRLCRSRDVPQWSWIGRPCRRYAP